jgi:hypothetical protein
LREQDSLMARTISLTGPAYGKLRIVNFLVDEMGKQHRLKQGDGVAVVVASDEVEPSGL